MAKVVGYDEAVKPRVTCRGCGAIIEYTKAEVQIRRGTDCGGGADGSEWVICPGCGDKATIRSW